VEGLTEMMSNGSDRAGRGSNIPYFELIRVIFHIILFLQCNNCYNH
jgi:hypothetical protein